MIKINAAIKEIFQLTANNKTIPLDHFMKIALSHYYNNAEIFGAGGDFITSPEVSQMFGETIGIWCALIFEKFNFEKFSIAEIGPGRGLLTKDLLRATKNIEKFNLALNKIYLIETSPTLIDIQKENLVDSRISWLKNIDDLPNGNLIIIANEFFDALPIKQFKKVENGWNEIVIGQNKGELIFKEVKSEYSAEAPLESIVEIAEEMQKYAKLIISKINRGAFLTFDYGYLKSNFVSTLQAVKAHKYSPILKDVGASDLTTHVDFLTLNEVFQAANFSTHIISQNEFLTSYGIMLRAQRLVKAGANVKDISMQLDRLLSSKHMGYLFKVLQAVKE